jgi:hypothetical protein
MPRLADQLDGLGRRARGCVFQEQGQKVRQFARGRRIAAILVQLDEVDHRLTTIPALAVYVLEQMQGQRTRPVEQEDVALLSIEQIAPGKIVDQGIHRCQIAAVEHGLTCKNVL